jgi:hypothetical protein
MCTTIIRDSLDRGLDAKTTLYVTGTRCHVYIAAFDSAILAPQEPLHPHTAPPARSAVTNDRRGAVHPQTSPVSRPLVSARTVKPMAGSTGIDSNVHDGRCDLSFFCGRKLLYGQDAELAGAGVMGFWFGFSGPLSA